MTLNIGGIYHIVLYSQHGIWTKNSFEGRLVLKVPFKMPLKRICLVVENVYTVEARRLECHDATAKRIGTSGIKKEISMFQLFGIPLQSRSKHTPSQKLSGS